MQAESSSASPRCTGSARHRHDRRSAGARSEKPVALLRRRGPRAAAPARSRGSRGSRPRSRCSPSARSPLAAGPVTISSRCERAHQERWKMPLFTPTDIRSVTRPAGRLDPARSSGARCASRTPPAPRARRGPPRRRRAGARRRRTSRGCRRSRRPRRAAARRPDPSDVRDLLGADLAVAGQPLGHLREPGDVDEDHRAVELAHDGAGRLVQPGDQQTRQVRPQPLCGIDGPLGSLGAHVGRRHGPSLARRTT